MSETWPLPSKTTSSSGAFETRRKIRAFATLPEGWHFGDGVSASPATEAIALRLQTEAVAVGLLYMNAFPGISGEIRLTLYEPNYLEFTIEIDGAITFLEERDGREVDYQAHLSPENALSIIQKAGRKLWASYAFSTTGTTIGMNIDSKPSPSATQQTIPVFP
jgi:hypothetical protein